MMDTKRVKELTGLTDNQITYLINNVDALKREKSQGKARDYSFRDLVYLKLASVMRSDGMRLPEINGVISVLGSEWINENPNDAGTLLKVYVKDAGHRWAWTPHFLTYDDTVRIHFPKYLYNVEYYATELAKLDQLELNFMSEAKAVN